MIQSQRATSVGPDQKQAVTKVSLRSIGQWFFRNVYNQIMPNGTAEMKTLLANCTSILDVGCGENSPLKYLPTNGKYKVGIDIYEPALIEAAKRNYHDEYRQMNALDIVSEFGPKSFDCVFCFDMVEHLSQKDSENLIDDMEYVARKVIIISTSNGYVPWTPKTGNPYQAHQCGWTIEAMRDRGYTVLGTGGWKRLRNRHNWFGPFHDARLLHFQNFLFDTTQIFVKKRPELAFELLCFKVLEPEK